MMLEQGLTRAQMAALLTRIVTDPEQFETDSAFYRSLCSFTDVPEWAKSYVGYRINLSVSMIGKSNKVMSEPALKGCTQYDISAGIHLNYTMNAGEFGQALNNFFCAVLSA